jgi:hypothetical protein
MTFTLDSINWDVMKFYRKDLLALSTSPLLPSTQALRLLVCSARSARSLRPLLLFVLLLLLLPPQCFEIVGGFYSEVASQKREAEGTVRPRRWRRTFRVGSWHQGENFRGRGVDFAKKKPPLVLLQVMIKERFCLWCLLCSSKLEQSTCSLALAGV